MPGPALLRVYPYRAQELLLASPWITESAARLISRELALLGPVSLQILARMDEGDFLQRDLTRCRIPRGTYPGNVRVLLRGCRCCMGRCLSPIRERVIIGSANLTDGGMYRNHEISLSSNLATCEAWRREFFRLWSVGFPVPDQYSGICLSVPLSRPCPDVTRRAPLRQGLTRDRELTRCQGYVTTFRYVSPAGARAARRLDRRDASITASRSGCPF